MRAKYNFASTVSPAEARGNSTTNAAKVAADPRELEGVGAARHADQPGPCWTPPPGAEAVAMTTPTLTIHPLADALPEMLTDEYLELVADIKTNGLREPLMLYENKILDGRHRYRACVELGITPNTNTFTGTAVDAKAYVVSLNVHRRHLTLDQKQKIAATELKRDPTQSDRAIGRKANVDNKTVAKVRAEAERREELPHVARRKDSVGRSQPVAKAKPTKSADTTSSGTPTPMSSKTRDGQPDASAPRTGYNWLADAIAQFNELDLLLLTGAALDDVRQRDIKGISKHWLVKLRAQVRHRHSIGQRRHERQTSPNNPQQHDDRMREIVEGMANGGATI